MVFPKDERIPVTEKELHAQGVNFCLHKILAKNQCMAKARVRASQRKIVGQNMPLSNDSSG